MQIVSIQNKVGRTTLIKNIEIFEMLSQQITRNNNNIKEISRGKNIFKRGCHPKNNLKEENRDIAADSHSILSTSKKYCCHL